MGQGLEGQAVIFAIGREQYGVGISSVREVVPWSEPTPLPQAPPLVEGVINLRGEVFPVVDLARRFGRPAGERKVDSRIMIVDLPGEAGRVGLVVDQVLEVLQIEGAQIAPPSPVVQSDREHLVQGVAKVGERLIILVDLAEVVREVAPWAATL